MRKHPLSTQVERSDDSTHVFIQIITTTLHRRMAAGRLGPLMMSREIVEHTDADDFGAIACGHHAGLYVVTFLHTPA